MKRTKLEIVNKKGIRLSASLELPANGKPHFYAIFAHCFTCNSMLEPVRNISRTLTNYGFGVVRFDFMGLGDSEGEFVESHFSGNVDDLIVVSDYLGEHFRAPSLLIGHSLGGAAAIVAASRLDNIKAVATIGAPASVSHAKRLFSEQVDLGSKEPVEVTIEGRPFRIDAEFVKDFDKTDLIAIVKSLRKPLLVMHAPHDKSVGIENARELYHHAFHPKSFISLDDADHLLTKSKDSQYVANMIGTWAKRYFGEEAENEMLDPEGEQLVAHINVKEDKFTTLMQTRKHSLIADEPESFGGDDLGPAPYDFLSAALASCSVLTVKLYAERKGWDLEEVYVYTTYAKKHSDDLMIDVEKPGNIDVMSKKLKFIGNLTEEQRNRLTEIAAKCPVHKTLTDKVVVQTEEIK